MSSNKTRILIGFVTAPSIVPLGFILLALAKSNFTSPVSQLLGTFVVYGAYSYIFALLFGLPIFWALHRGGYVRLWQLSVASTSIALAACAIFYSIGLMNWETFWTALASGAVSGAVFGVVSGFSNVK